MQMKERNCRSNNYFIQFYLTECSIDYLQWGNNVILSDKRNFCLKIHIVHFIWYPRKCYPIKQYLL